MKRVKKLMAAMLAMVMMLAMTCTAFAAKITITDANGTAANKFEIYQIFTGKIAKADDEKILSDIQWGNGVKTTEGKVLGKTAAEAAAAFADGTLKIDDFIEGNVLAAPTEATATDDKGSVVFDNLDPGYYFVQNKAGSAVAGEAYTKYILQVLDDVEIAAKTDAPAIEKKVKNEDEADTLYRDSNNVAIGDIVNYRITSTVPDLSNYTQYYFIVNDTLSKGLTLDEDSIAIKVGTKDLVEDTDYTVTTAKTADGETTLEIVFKKFIQYKDFPGDAIVITYDAKLNEDAEINATGNPNSVELTYSNNPNKVGKGEDKPEDDEKESVTGTTPKDWTITYTTKLAIIKTDGKGLKLKDAIFTFVGEKTNSTVTTTEKFEEDQDGAYYKLKAEDGKAATYTTVPPTPLTADEYDSTEVKYTRTVKSETTNVVESVNQKVKTDDNGVADLGSLAAGKYVITEIQAPDGYNMLTEPINITITCVVPEPVVNGTEPAVWTVKQGDTNLEVDSTLGAYKVDIVNQKGATLPSTGGIGTTIFYVVGGFLLVFAGVLLVVRRRVSK